MSDNFEEAKESGKTRTLNSQQSQGPPVSAARGRNNERGVNWVDGDGADVARSRSESRGDKNNEQCRDHNHNHHQPKKLSFEDGNSNNNRPRSESDRTELLHKVKSSELLAEMGVKSRSKSADSKNELEVNNRTSDKLLWVHAGDSSAPTSSCSCCSSSSSTPTISREESPVYMHTATTHHHHEHKDGDEPLFSDFLNNIERVRNLPARSHQQFTATAAAAVAAVNATAPSLPLLAPLTVPQSSPCSASPIREWGKLGARVVRYLQSGRSSLSLSTAQHLHYHDTVCGPWSSGSLEMVAAIASEALYVPVTDQDPIQEAKTEDNGFLKEVGIRLQTKLSRSWQLPSDCPVHVHFHAVNGHSPFDIQDRKSVV